MAVMAKKLGFDFAAITDHGKYAPSIEAIEKAQQINLNLLLLPGEEVAVPSAHIVSINADKCITDLKVDDTTYQQQIRNIMETDLKELIIKHINLLPEILQWRFSRKKIIKSSPFSLCTWCFYQFEKLNWLKEYPNSPWTRCLNLISMD